MSKPVVAAGVLAAALCWAALASAQKVIVDTSEKTGTLVVSIELRGKEAPQPYSLGPDGQPAKDSKGEPIAASHVEAADYYRRIDLEIPLFGYLSAGSGFREIDAEAGEKTMAAKGAAVPGLHPQKLPGFDQQTLEGLHAAIAACGDNAACMADATRALAAAAKNEETAPAEPATLSRLPDPQRYLALAARPAPASGTCGTATFTIDDHHLGRSMDAAAGWIDFDYRRQGRQSVPPGGVTPPVEGAQGFADTTPSPVTLCGVKVSLDLDEKVYHLDLAGLSPTVRTVRTGSPEASPTPVSLMGDGPTKLLFLGQAGSGTSISVAPFEIAGFSYVTGAQGQKLPLDATISWSITVNEALPK